MSSSLEKNATYNEYCDLRSVCFMNKVLKILLRITLNRIYEWKFEETISDEQFGFRAGVEEILCYVCKYLSKNTE